ncbi:MAG: acyltransferase [Planctomycetaceae bacterium]|jgi:peptidoglycan/LPS O-acetylase OafA/YrhL|nr:acyltransferase [Planctomycetaceae bacterium]
MSNRDSIALPRETLSKETFQLLKGLLAVGIVLDHLAQRTNWIFSPLDTILSNSGAPIVSCFFFISGYGLTASFLSKKRGYFDKFFSNRILKILIPFFCAIVLFQLFAYCNGDGHNITSIIGCLSRGDETYVLPYSWYVFAILYFYIAFYCVFNYVTENVTKGLICLFFVSVLYIGITSALEFKVQWYGSTFAFNIGTIWKYKEETIMRFLHKKRVVFVFFLSMLLLCLLKYYHFMPSKPLLLTLVYKFEIIFSTTLIVTLCYLRIPNLPFLAYLGTISYEIYLLQGIPMRYLRKEESLSLSDGTYIFLSLLFTILSAAILHRLLAIKMKRIK